MGIVINHNIPALQSYNTVSATMNALQKSIQKLSTGLRINSAADDAAGLAISEKMRAQIRGLDRAVSNSQDGISMIQTAEGALNETHSILQRMRELSVQSANDTLTQQDRGYIQLEIDQLREEITRIGNTTQFNKKKLLDGSAAVLWSSDNLETKAIVNGGLRQIDQFGQKRALEGNYNISIKAEAGQAEVQKTDIFKVKHENVIVLGTKAEAIKDVRVQNLQRGDYTVNGVAAAAIAAARIASTSAAPGGWADGVVEASDDIVGFEGAQYELVMELKSKTIGTTTTPASATVSVGGRVTFADGSSRDIAAQDVVLTANANAANYTLTGAVWQGTGDLEGIAINGANLDVTNLLVGDKAIYQFGPNAANTANPNVAAGDVQIQVNDPSAQLTAGALHRYNLNTAAVAGKDVTLNHFYFEGGQVKTGSVTLSIAGTKPDGNALAAADLIKSPLTTFKALKVGDVATSGVKLRDLDKFWDSQGRFMLTDPQTITVTQGDGKQAKMTLYANDTLGDVAKKFNDAIGGTLGQGKYVGADGTHFTTFVESATAAEAAAKQNTSEAVDGTFVIRSVAPGASGKLSFAGDEDLIKAFSLNVIQDAKESNYTVDITDAHTGATVVSGAKTTGNRLLGVLNPNIDVEFDAMAGVTAKWDDTRKAYVFNPTTDYKTVLHLADNTTVFQIGANEGEDMGINIGDMRSHALGLNSVLVTDRESAARSITIIDNAIDKVSTQRAKLGAYQNRLEHTISNLTVAGENLTAAESRIRDADMAKEMMNFTKLNIMLQAGNAMLAQANQLPQNVLSLLR